MDIACMLALEAARMEPSRDDETKRILIVNVDKEKKQGCQHTTRILGLFLSLSLLTRSEYIRMKTECCAPF